MDIVRMTQADLERLVEDRLRQARDGNGSREANDEGNAPARGSSSSNEHTRTSDPARAPLGTTWRGSRSPNGRPEPTVSDEDAAHIMGFLRGVRDGDRVAARRSFEALGAHQRTQQVSVDADGGYTVPYQFVSEVVVQLPFLTPFADAALIRIVPMQSETMRWTKVLTKPAKPPLVAEGAAYTKSGVTFGLIELVARKIGEIIPFTEEIMQSNQIAMVQLIAELVAEQLAYQRNALVTSGTGVGQPEGVLTNANIAATAWDATSAATSADSVINAFHALQTAYRRDAIWLMHNDTIKLVRKLKDAQNRYLWTDGFAQTPAMLMGRPVYENPDLPINGGAGANEATVLFGNFKRGDVIGQREGLTVDRNSSGTDWEADIVNFKFRERWDGKVNDEAAFIKVTGVK